MTFTGIFSVFKDKLWSYHVMIPPKIADELISKCTDKRVICKVGKDYSFQCAMLPDGNGGYFVMFNKERRKELNLNTGDTVEITLNPLKNRSGNLDFKLLNEDFKNSKF